MLGPAIRSRSPSTLGGSDALDVSITDFSHHDADQNERDYQEFVQAVQSGRLEAAKASEDSRRPTDSLPGKSELGTDLPSHPAVPGAEDDDGS
jgi:hypothetical protein